MGPRMDGKAGGALSPEKNDLKTSCVANGGSTDEKNLLLLRRLEEVEKERDKLQRALEASQAGNEELAGQSAASKEEEEESETAISHLNHQPEQPKQEEEDSDNQMGHYKLEILRLKTELHKVKKESATEISQLKEEIHDLKESEAALIQTKERLAARVKDLLADTINQKMFGDYNLAPPDGPPTASTVAAEASSSIMLSEKEMTVDSSNRIHNDKLELEQSDLIAAKINKKDKRGKGNRRHKSYGYKIPMPTEAEFENELLGKEVYIPSIEEKIDASSSDDEVSLEFDEEQADFIRAAAERQKSFFDKLFGD